MPSQPVPPYKLLPSHHTVFISFLVLWQTNSYYTEINRESPSCISFRENWGLHHPSPYHCRAWSIWIKSKSWTKSCLLKALHHDHNFSHGIIIMIILVIMSFLLMFFLVILVIIFPTIWWSRSPSSWWVWIIKVKLEEKRYKKALHHKHGQFPVVPIKMQIIPLFADIR